MKMSPKTIEAILQTASPWIHRNASEASFSIVCTVEEGTACRFSQAQWGDKTLDELAPVIIAQIGWKRIEHSAQRQVVLRCSVPGRDAARAKCEIDRGDGFVPVPVSQA